MYNRNAITVSDYINSAREGKLRSLPPCYLNDKKLVTEVKCLINDGYRNYKSCDDCSQEIIASHCLRILGLDAADFLTNSDYTHTLIGQLQKYLKTSSFSTYGYDICRALSKAVREYITDDMDLLFEELIAEESI